MGKKFEICGYKDNDKWDYIHNILIDAMINFARTLKHLLRN